MKSTTDLLAEADALEAQAKALREKASSVHRAAQLAKPLLERMIFAAYERCACGAGMAYDPTSEDGPFKRPGAWQCSAIIRFDTLAEDEKVKTKNASHTPALPFAFYEVKSEVQPSANGATTRPA